MNLETYSKIVTLAEACEAYRIATRKSSVMSVSTAELEKLFSVLVAAYDKLKGIP